MVHATRSSVWTTAAFLLAGVASVACQPAASSDVELTTVTDIIAGDPGVPPSTGETLLGTPLRDLELPPNGLERLEEDLAIALAQFHVAPEREDSYIWVGRRLGYLARWDDAIAVFTRGIEAHPDSYKLYRFRGRHRARARQLELAVEDYLQAAALIEGHEDSYEPDGIINSRHQFLGSYRSNIHYYLAQASFALGDYETALAGMTSSIQEPLVQSPDHQMAATYWLYLTLRKLGRHDEAAELVAGVPDGLEMLENDTYYDGVRLFRGDGDADQILQNGDVISKFAVAMLKHFGGDQEGAREIWQSIVDDSAQGFWPAEAELLREATQ